MGGISTDAIREAQRKSLENARAKLSNQDVFHAVFNDGKDATGNFTTVNGIQVFRISGTETYVPLTSINHFDKIKD